MNVYDLTFNVVFFIFLKFYPSNLMKTKGIFTLASEKVLTTTMATIALTLWGLWKQIVTFLFIGIMPRETSTVIPNVIAILGDDNAVNFANVN